MNDFHSKIIKDIQESDNPVNTAIDHGCEVSFRALSQVDIILNRQPLNVVLPGIINQVEIKGTIEL